MDYLKLDGVGTQDIQDVLAWSKALRNTGRKIHLELSKNLDVNNAKAWQDLADGWRTGKTQMSLWSLAASPLFLGADLTHLDRPTFRCCVTKTCWRWIRTALTPSRSPATRTRRCSPTRRRTAT